MDLHDKLLNWAGEAKVSAIVKKTGKSKSEVQADIENGSRPVQRKGKVTAEQVLEKLQRQQGNPELRRRFLLRLGVALHNYGSSAPRTEYLLEKVADKIGIDVNIAVFPALLAIAFPVSEYGKQETHLLNVEGDLDIDKLGRVDQLANDVGEEGHEVLAAYWLLKSIASTPPMFGFWTKLAAFGLLSGTASLLFFSGNLVDAFIATLLGLFIGVLDHVSSKHAVVSQVSEFIAATVASFVAKALATSAPASWQICYYPITLAALVWLLPGLSLTIGVSELVAKAYISGSTRIVAALFVALQLGFGMAVGEQLVWWNADKLPKECPNSGMTEWWWQIVWFSGYCVASNVLLGARWDQWTGMVLVSAFGWVAAVVSTPLGGDASSVIAAFVIGITGALYSYFTNHLPLAMKTSGILLLVPGGLGVQGVAAILSDDVLSGMSFVFDMLVVGLCITIGLLVAKIVVPIGLFGNGKAFANTRSTLAIQLESDRYDVDSESDSEEEDSMAI